MSDYSSSLPVRSENNGDVVAIICDGTTTTQKLAIDANGKIVSKLNDGSGNAITSQVNGAQRALDVGINVAGVQVDPRDVRALTNADVVTAEQGGTWDINNISGTISLPTGAATEATLLTVEADLAAINAKLVSGTDIGDVTVNNGSGAAAVNIQDGGNSITVDAVALDIRALTSADVVTANIKDATGTAFSAGNPLPVSVVATATGTDVLDFKQATAVAAAGSDTHTYTVTALKTLNLQHIQATGSGKIKVEISLGANLKVVLFNSTAFPNVDYVFSAPQGCAAGSTVNVKIYNLEKSSQDLYSTIEGYEF